MKRSNIILALILAATMLASCGNSGSSSAVESKGDDKSTVATESFSDESSDSTESENTSSEAESQPAAPAVIKEEMYADLTKGCPDNFEASDGWTNGSMFNVYWRAANVTFENGAMQQPLGRDRH